MPHPPEPPIVMPPARTVLVPGRGECFLRDSGGDGPPVLLLHGWTVTADLNWYAQYDPLIRAGYRVLAIDHRGHGRGLRALENFDLEACADDAAGVLRELDTGPAVLAGYSMGGPIALLTARRHSDVVRALVLCGTSAHWSAPRMRLLWWSMALYRLLLGIAPYSVFRGMLRLAGMPDSAATTWAAGELVRGSARDIAEAGRELGRFDARDWLGALDVPAAVVVTMRDRAVPPAFQRDLARRLNAAMVESGTDHLDANRPEFTRALLTAVGAVTKAQPAAASPRDGVAAPRRGAA
ncbi:MAG TPA: alpha/beta hydrolase [Solirubrobacter sp.]|nr:alpha/beta hydrolase [Solirubrobacter sp.]